MATLEVSIPKITSFLDENDLSLFLQVLLAKTFAENYSKILSNFTADDQESDVSVVNLTVQFFTVKSIAHILLQETDVFKQVVEAFSKRLIDHIKEFGTRMDDDEDENFFQVGKDVALSVLMFEERSEFARFEVVLTDLMYLLRVPFDKFTDASR